MSGIVVKSFQDADELVAFDHGHLDLIKTSSLALAASDSLNRLESGQRRMQNSKRVDGSRSIVGWLRSRTHPGTARDLLSHINEFYVAVVADPWSRQAGRIG